MEKKFSFSNPLKLSLSPFTNMHPKILIALALSAFALANPLPEPHWQHKEQNKNKHIEGNKNPEENKQVDAWSAARGRM